ncbi:porin family protein [Nonlabens ponticola]|uniref:PorT family protein n=1 Tax=Nonlabens ponticola TaxID=2496866 RepID=A0A3S9MWC0_9FLAO|nr:porin family protein [Nonlabens ponticola]AZQ43429.1 PorT family protein [Nonlabens ponticola]
MKKALLSFLFLLTCFLSHAQPPNLPRDENAIPDVVDSLYREDQFYIGLSFNLINNEPDDFSQNGFSGGLHVGFIRDMPINKRRNVAIGLGLGLSTNTYNSNLFIGEVAGEQSVFSILDESEIDFNTNRFNTNLVEVPIQLRWRTSTPTTFNFWRIYSGIKLGYIYYFKSSYRSDTQRFTQTRVDELNRIRYAATLSVGNGSFNAFVHYNLNTLFNDSARIDGAAINLQPIKFGIEFYLL